MAKKTTAQVKDNEPTKKVSKEAKAETELLEKVKKDFKASWDYAAGSWHQRWENNYKLYNNERVKVGYVGISKTFVPMTFSTVETMTSALFGAKPKFNFLPPRNKSDQKTDTLNALLDYYWEKDQWSIKVINTGRSMLMRGVGVDYFYWNGDHPCMINIPLRDFFIDPTATSLENARYMGRRFLYSKSKLESFEIVDVDGKADEDGNPPMKPKYKNLDKIKNPNSTKSGQATTQETTDKQEKDIFYGSTLTPSTGDSEDDDDEIEVIEYWGCVKVGDKWEDRVISIANRSVIIEDSENYFKAKSKANGNKYAEALIPFAAARDYVDESLFYAKGEVDFIADQQEDLNDISNQNKDSITYTLNQMYSLDTTKTGLLPNEVENLPGAVYPGEGDFLRPIQRGVVPPDAFMERQNIKNEIRETSAANEIVKGARQEGGQATATEINAQIAGSGQRINLKVTQIENEYFHRMGRVVRGIINCFVTEKMAIRVIGKDGSPRDEEYDPEEYSEGEYEPRVQLDITIQNKKSEAAASAKEMLAAFLNDEHVNQIWLKKKVLGAGFELDPDELEEAFAPMPEPPMPEMPPVDPMAGAMGMGDPMMGGMPPMDPGMMPPMPEEDMALMGGDPMQDIPPEALAVLMEGGLI